jgi:hypothetical protein
MTRLAKVALWFLDALIVIPGVLPQTHRAYVGYSSLAIPPRLTVFRPTR